MSYFAKINLGRPVAQAALNTVLDMVLQIEEVQSLPDEPWSIIAWASGDDFETFEMALAEDSSVASYTCLTELPNKRLYKLTLSEEGQRTTLQSVAVEENITRVSLTMTAEGVEFLGRFPTREALAALRDVAREKERDFTLLNLYEEKPSEHDGGRNNRYGVTAPQSEALLAALEQGYFNTPRQTTMETIADNLGISTSALSSRLRRGQQALLRNTLVQDPTI